MLVINVRDRRCVETFYNSSLLSSRLAQTVSRDRDTVSGSARVLVNDLSNLPCFVSHAE